MGLNEPKKTLNNQQKSSKDPNFRLLSQMIRKGKLDIRLILASPRTGSTLLETSFIKNSTINTCAHEPFRHSKNIEDVKEGYEAIFKKIKSRARRSGKISIVIKEMGRRLAVGNEYQRFLTLVKIPPIILIRNPLLSTESKIRAILKGLDQKKNLESFALLKGFKSWDSMLEESFASQDYKLFGEILSDETIYKSEPPATLEQMHYLEFKGRSFVIVDSTDYRLDPQAIVNALCKKWNVPFSNNMIKWGSAGKKLEINQPTLNNWFDRVQNSTGIAQPSEISPTLDDFPDFIVKHLKEVELPAYYEMFNHPNRVKPNEDSLQKPISLHLEKKTKLGLREIGEKGIVKVELSIFFLDPIYSIVSKPRLMKDDEFLKTNKRYLPTLNIINELMKSRSSF